MAIKFYTRLELIQLIRKLDTKIPLPQKNLPSTHSVERKEAEGNLVYTFKLTDRKNSAKQKLYSMETCTII